MKQIFTNIVTCKTSPYLPIDYTNSVCVKLSLIGHTQENNIYGKSFPNGQLCRRVLLAGAPIYMGKIYCTSSGSGTHRLNKFFHKLLLFHCNTRLNSLLYVTTQKRGERKVLLQSVVSNPVVLIIVCPNFF